MSKLQELYEQSNGVQASKKAGSRLQALYEESNTGQETAPPSVTPTSVVTPPTKQPSFLSRAFALPGKLIQGAGDLLANTKYMQDVGVGLNTYDKPSMAEKTLQKAASFVGGSSPENLPLGVGEVVKQSKDYLKDTQTPNVSLGDWLTGMKQGAQQFTGGLISVAGDLPSYATAGKLQPEIRWNIPGIGEVKNTQFRIAERIANGEDVNSVVAQEQVGGIMNLLFAVGLVSRPFIKTPTTIAKGNIKQGPGSPGIVPPGGGVPPVKSMQSFKLYSPAKYTTPITPEVIQKTANELGVDLRNTKYNPNMPTYFVMENQPNGSISLKFVQVKPSFAETFIGKLKGDVKVLPPNEAYTIFEKTVDAKSAEVVKSAPVPVKPPVEVPVVPPVPKAPVVSPETPVVTPAPVVEKPVITPETKAAVLKKIQETQAKKGTTITDVTPAGYGPEPTQVTPEAQNYKTVDEFKKAILEDPAFSDFKQQLAEQSIGKLIDLVNKKYGLTLTRDEVVNIDFNKYPQLQEPFKNGEFQKLAADDTNKVISDLWNKTKAPDLSTALGRLAAEDVTGYVPPVKVKEAKLEAGFKKLAKDPERIARVEKYGGKPALTIKPEDIGVEVKARAEQILQDNLRGRDVTPEYRKQALEKAEFEAMREIKDSIGGDMSKISKKSTDYTKIKGKFFKRPEQLVTKTQVKDMLKGVGKDSVDFKVIEQDGKKYLTYKDAKNDMKLRPSALGLVEDNILPGQTININAQDLKAPGTALRGISAEGTTYASKGAGPVDSFENRIGEPTKADKPNFKLYEKVQGLIKKYATRVGEGHLRKGVGGTFFHNTKNILLKGMNDLAVAAHEITHSLDLTNQISKDIMKVDHYSKDGKPIYDPATAKLRKEITDMYVNNYPGARRDEPLEKRVVEGFATLLQKYVEQPTTTTQNYPNIVREFLKSGGKFYQPVIGEIIGDLEQIVTDYQRLDPLDKIGARVTSDLNETGKESFLSKEEYIRTEIADEVYPIEKLATEAGVGMTKDDPSLWIRQYNSQSSLFANNVKGDKGYWAYKNGGFHKALDFNWGDLMKDLEKKQQFDQFNHYLVARDQYFQFQELDARLAEVNRLKSEIMDVGIEEAATTVDESGESLLDQYKKAEKDYVELKSVLDKNQFSREVVTESYNLNKDTFKKEEQMFDALTREDLKLLHNPDVGLISDTQFKELSSQKGYASLKRKFYDEIVGDERATPSGIAGPKPSSLKRRTGSSRTIIAPVYNGIKNHAEILRKSLKQVVNNKIVNIALKNTHPDLFQPLGLKKYQDPETKAWMYPQEKDPTIIMGRINGQRVPVLVDSYIKKTIDEIIDFKNIGIFEKLLQGANRFFVKGTTGLFPGFTLTNFSIDQITAVAQTRHNYIPIYSALKEFYKSTSNINSPEAQYYAEYMAMGGERQTIVGWQDLSARELAAKIAQERTGMLKVIDYLNKGGDIISIPQKYSEIVTRATEYIKSRKAGNPQIVALEEAGRVTAPFHHVGRLGGGRFMKTIVKSIPFFNPALQVLEQNYRSGFKSGKKYSQRMLFTILAVTAAQVAALGLILSAGSKDQKEQYKDLEPSEMTKYMFLPDPTNSKKLIKIRMPDLFNTFGVMINMAIMDMIADTKYTTGDYISSGTSFLPGQLNVFKPKELIFSWVPQAVKPGLSVALNKKDFPSVRDLVSSAQARKEPSQQFTESTPYVTKKLGAFLNMSPIKLDALITGYAGRASGFLLGKPGIYNPFTTLKKEYYFESGRRLQTYYDKKVENDAKYNSLLHKLRPFTAEERMAVMKERAVITSISNLLEDYRNIDEKKFPERSTQLRDKIITQLEKI